MKANTFFGAPLLCTAVLAQIQAPVREIKSQLKALDTIKSVTYGGTGCPGGSVALPDPPQLPTVSLVYPKFKATSSPGGSIRDSRKNCQANVDYVFSGPAAGSLIVKTILQIDLAAGATATQKSTYYISGSSNQKVLSSDLTGPLSKTVVYTDNVPLASIADGPLQGEVAVNVNTAVNFGLGDNTGSLIIKSTEITLAPPPDAAAPPAAAPPAIHRMVVEH